MYNRQPASAAADHPPAKESETAAVATPETDTVSLRGDAALVQDSTPSQPSEVFAEIWKDGMKIGVVYADGQATLPSAAGNGAMSPYLRAEEISRQVGGEVHYVDIPAFKVAQTRAQLRAAYGS